MRDTQGGRLYMLDSKTGELVWTTRGRWADHASVLATPNDVLALTDRGQLNIYRPERRALEEIASYVVADDGTWSHPAMSSNYIVTKDTATVSVWRVGSVSEKSGS